MSTESITHRIGRYSDTDSETIIYEVTDEDGIAAALYLDPETHMVMQVETREDRQREGLATRLFRAADDEIGAYHAPEWARTPEGDRWAQACGGDVMDDETAARITGTSLADIFGD